MKRLRPAWPALLLAAALALPPAARAQSEASAVLSMLPLASLVGTTVAVAELSAAGARFTVAAVQASARGTVVVLERASDGLRATVEISGRAAGKGSLAAGTVITASAVGAGVVLEAAGEAIAFLPNASGRALLHDERITP